MPLSRQLCERKCHFWLIIGDLGAIVIALTAAYYIRFNLWATLLPDNAPFAPVGTSHFSGYFASILFGTFLELLLLVLFGAYRSVTLLRFRRAFVPLIKSLIAWILIFSTVSLILKLDAGLSRVYVLISFLFLCLNLALTRFLVLRALANRGLTTHLRERIIFVDWSTRAATIASAVQHDPWHPYELIGVAPSPRNTFSSTPPPDLPIVDRYADVAALCEKRAVDIVVLADGGRSEEDIVQLARTCEQSMVNFMVIPSGFQILLSGLELTTVSSVPLLGVTRLPLDHPLNSTLKRAVDVIGATFGLLISLPVIAVFSLLVYRESPGPIFYRQTRVGRKGREFSIIKIRSMQLDAEQHTGARWASKDDPRRLRIGTFMRRWNIDELPQFWNVLVGDLSLVGPRPERPELIQRFREEIPFYNARHNIIPGMTGWAQINGFRGDTDLNERIRCDIFYIENWNLLLDFQIMIMTFLRWEGAR